MFAVVEQGVPAAPGFAAAGPVLHDASTAGTVSSPNARDEVNRVERDGERHALGLRADVVQLHLPVVREAVLHAGRVLQGLRRTEIQRKHDPLRLSVELGAGGRGRVGSRVWRSLHESRRPGIGKADRPGIGALGLLYVGREGRILLVAVTGVEVGVVVSELEAAAEDGLSIALGVDGEAEVGRELMPGCCW